MNSKKSGGGGAAAAGIGLAALAAAAAGAYFLYGKDGEKHRRQIKGWALKAKGEILDQMEHMKNVNEDMYNNVVEKVTKRYGAIAAVDKKEVAQMVRELQGHWKSISRQIQHGAKKPAAKKSTRRSTKK